MKRSVGYWRLGMMAATVALAAGGAVRAADGDIDAGPQVVPAPDQPLAVNAMLGSINGKPLFVEDILRPIDADLRRIARVASTAADFRQQARDAINKQIKQQLGDILIIKAAEDSLDDDDRKRVEMFMNKTRNDILSKNGGSQALADEYYRARGNTFERELADIKRRATVELYLRHTLYPRITITRKMILDYYNANLKQYTEEAKVDLYTITVPFWRFLPKEPDPSAPAATPPKMRPISNPTAEQLATARNLALERAKDLIEEIKKASPADFPKLVEDNSVDPKQHSGGRWKDTRRGDLLSKEVEDVAFSLAPHTIGPPLMINADSPAEGGVMIIKVEDVNVGRVLPFSEAQQSIESAMRDKQYATLSREYYNKLFEKASIEAVESMMDTATNVAVTRYFTR